MSYLFPSSTITFDAALRDIAQGSPRARAFAAHALGDVTDPTEKRRALEALIRALDDDRLEVRAEAASSLGDLREPAALPSLIKRLDDGAPIVRQNAAIALGTIGHPDGFEPLATALRDGPGDLRFQAATSLAEIDRVKAFDPLAGALTDKDPQVVAAAALSLGAIGDARAVPLLSPLVEHKDRGTRFDVAYALAELGDPTGRPVLIEELDDLDRAWDAVVALETLGTPDDIKALSRSLSNKRMPPEATVLAAAAVLRKSDHDPSLPAPSGRGSENDPARKVLLAALVARKVHVRGLAVEQLAEVGGVWAREPLEKLARTGKGSELLEPIAQALRAIAERT